MIEKRGKWYVAHVPQIPGVNTQGISKIEARRNLKEAPALIMIVNRKLAVKSKQI